MMPAAQDHTKNTRGHNSPTSPGYEFWGRPAWEDAVNLKLSFQDPFSCSLAFYFGDAHGVSQLRFYLEPEVSHGFQATFLCNHVYSMLRSSMLDSVHASSFIFWLAICFLLSSFFFVSQVD